MKDTLKSLLSDGQGNSSMMRLLVFIIVITTIASKFYNAWITKTPVAWDSTDLTLILGPLGAKLVQNTQENSTPTVPEPPKAP